MLRNALKNVVCRTRVTPLRLNRLATTTCKTTELPQHSESSHAYAVRKFTRHCGQPVPERPVALSEEEVFFVIKMAMDELFELAATVAGPERSKSYLSRYIEESRNIPQTEYPGEEGKFQKIADQADALIDLHYYSLNTAARHGINLDSMFHVVHQANMAKRDPETGVFLKRDDGKILKPKGWEPPNCVAEIKRQCSDGSFPKQ